MAKPRLTEGTDPHPEVRLELTNAEGRQIWALYSEPPHAVAAPDSPAARLFGQLPAIAWRWRRRVAVGALAGAALGVVYLLTADPVYVVRALVHIEQRDSVLQQYDTVRSGATFMKTQSQVIRSLVGNAIDTLGLPERPSPGLLAKAKRWARSVVPLPTESEPQDPRTAAVLSALAALGATPMVGTDVMAISFRTAEPQGGVAFLDALIARYREYTRSLETDAHREGLELLRRQDDELRIELEGLQARYDELHAGVMALGQDENVFSLQKMRLEEHARAHVEAQGRRIELENRLALHAQRREQLARDSVEQLAGLERELHAARRTEQMLSRLYDEEWATAKKLEIRRQNEEQIRKTIERVGLKRDAVDALLRDKELRVLSLESGHSGTVVRILDPPRLPTQKVWPSPGIVLTAFGFGGVLAGLGLAVLGELRPSAAGVWRS